METTDQNERLYAVAVAVISSPGLHRVWSSLHESPPSDIFKRIQSVSSPGTLEYYRCKYSSVPLIAAAEIIEQCRKKGMSIVTYWDAGYPELLRQIDQPPVVLFYKGIISMSPKISIVGTRNSDKQSSETAYRIAHELVERGFAISSGMALGIDRDAHRGALDANGSTIAVLANSVDKIYPVHNTDICRRIIESGNSAIVSEYPPGIEAGKWTFVRRNRIVSGMSLGTVVVQAAEKSGALITARFALEQNREVFACTGYPFDASYAGCHKLINNGAILIGSTDDITGQLFQLGFQSFKSTVQVKEEKYVLLNQEKAHPANDEIDEDYSPLAKKILTYLSKGEMAIDSLLRQAGCKAAELQENLIVLELSGKVIRNGNVLTKI
jgi:DNA processing protein